MKQESKICPHCEPLYKNPHHSWELVGDYLHTLLQKTFSPVSNFILHSNLSNASEKVFLNSLIAFLRVLRLGKFVEISDDERNSMQKRISVIVQEALVRGYFVEMFKVFGHCTDIFRFSKKHGTVFVFHSPLLNSFDSPKIDFDDKYLFKKLLADRALPHAPGTYFRRMEPALTYAQALGFPVVVKPRSGSLSRHTSVNIRSREEFERAFRVVKEIAVECIVEKHIKGALYRCTVVNHVMVACALREPPYVMGDGVHTIRQLIEIKRAHYPHKKLRIVSSTESFLKKQRVGFDSIPPTRTKVYLHNKIILAGGGEISDVTDIINKENVELLEEISCYLSTSLVGFDIITSDISQSWRETTFVVIEANSNPYIDMHHFPDSGRSRNIATAILDAMESRLGF